MVSGNVEDGASKWRATLQGDIRFETSGPERRSFDRENVVAAAIILEERDEDVTATSHKNPTRWSTDTHLMPLVSQSSEREDLNPRIRYDPRIVVT